MGFAVLEQVLVGFPLSILVEKVRGLIRPLVSHMVAAEFPPEHFEMAGIWVWKEKCRQDLGADVNQIRPELLILNFNRVLSSSFILFI